LVQRLDAVLGVQMGAQASMVAALRADAIVQPGSAVRPGQVEGEPSPQAQAAAIAARDATLGSVTDTKLQTALQLAGSNVRQVRQDTTPSAPTALGFTARTILALLAQFPEASPPLTGRAPLWMAGAADAAVEGEGDTPGRPAGASDAGRPAAGATGAGATGAASATADADAAAAPGNPASAALAGNAGNAALGAEAADAANGASATAGAADADAAPALRGGPAAQGAQAASSASSPMAAQLDQGLRHAIQSSGLFYESHLADLLFGEKTVAQLRQEPQGKIVTPPPAHDAADTRAPQMAAQHTTSSPGDAARGAQAANDMDQAANSLAGTDAPRHTPAAPSPSALAASAAAAADPNGLHPQTTLMVRQQLDVLAQQTINWRGEAWPNADMDWEIRRDPNGAADADQATWSTRLGLILPRLGEIEARISLSGNQVVLRIAAPASGGEIGEAAETLRARFGAAGLTLSNLAVQSHRESAFGDGA
jgi:hypothetical protein